MTKVIEALREKRAARELYNATRNEGAPEICLGCGRENPPPGELCPWCEEARAECEAAFEEAFDDECDRMVDMSAELGGCSRCGEASVPGTLCPLCRQEWEEALEKDD